MDELLKTAEGVQNLQNKRKFPSFEHKKKKAKRRRNNDDSDDSDFGRSDYRDRRVFDSDEDSDMEISDELTGDKKRVLEFMQNATPNELKLMNSCSKKKVDALMESRPFTGWIDLVINLTYFILTENN